MRRPRRTPNRRKGRRLKPFTGAEIYRRASSTVLSMSVATWEMIAFEPEAVFGSGEYAAMFGRFAYRSRVPPARVAGMERGEPPRNAGRYCTTEGNWRQWRQGHRGEWNPSQALPFTMGIFPFSRPRLRKEEDDIIRIPAAIGMTALGATPALAQSYCVQVRQAVATLGYFAARRHALAHYGIQAVRYGDRCLRGAQSRYHVRYHRAHMRYHSNYTPHY